MTVGRLIASGLTLGAGPAWKHPHWHTDIFPWLPQKDCVTLCLLYQSNMLSYRPEGFEAFYIRSVQLSCPPHASVLPGGL